MHISSDFNRPKLVELRRRHAQIAPFIEPAVSFFTNSGTESVEATIKLARYHSKRSQFIGFLRGFHGKTMEAVSFTASKITRRSVMTWPRGSPGNTHGGNPIACMAALATLDLIESDYLENTIETGTFAIDIL